MSPLQVQGCNKSATYIMVMGAGYVLSSVRKAGEVKVKGAEGK